MRMCTLLYVCCPFRVQVSERYAFVPREAVTKFLVLCTECPRRSSGVPVNLNINNNNNNTKSAHNNNNSITTNSNKAGIISAGRDSVRPTKIGSAFQPIVSSGRGSAVNNKKFNTIPPSHHSPPHPMSPNSRSFLGMTPTHPTPHSIISFLPSPSAPITSLSSHSICSLLPKHSSNNVTVSQPSYNPIDVVSHHALNSITALGTVPHTPLLPTSLASLSLGSPFQLPSHLLQSSLGLSHHSSLLHSQLASMNSLSHMASEAPPHISPNKQRIKSPKRKSTSSNSSHSKRSASHNAAGTHVTTSSNFSKSAVSIANVKSCTHTKLTTATRDIDSKESTLFSYSTQKEPRNLVSDKCDSLHFSKEIAPPGPPTNGIPTTTTPCSTVDNLLPVVTTPNIINVIASIAADVAPSTIFNSNDAKQSPSTQISSNSISSFHEPDASVTKLSTESHCQNQLSLIEKQSESLPSYSKSSSDCSPKKEPIESSFLHNSVIKSTPTEDQPVSQSIPASPGADICRASSPLPGPSVHEKRSFDEKLSNFSSAVNYSMPITTIYMKHMRDLQQRQEHQQKQFELEQQLEHEEQQRRIQEWKLQEELRLQQEQEEQQMKYLLLQQQYLIQHKLLQEQLLQEQQQQLLHQQLLQQHHEQQQQQQYVIKIETTERLQASERQSLSPLNKVKTELSFDSMDDSLPTIKTIVTNNDSDKENNDGNINQQYWVRIINIIIDYANTNQRLTILDE